MIRRASRRSTHGGIERRRAVGKLKNLAGLLAREPLAGTSGIGHTRWATHGGVTETNAHPHAVGDVVVVHNGIIENFRALKDELIAEGAVFTTQTDTEVVAQLLARELKRGKPPREAVQGVLRGLQGAFALAILFKGENDLMIARAQRPAAGRRATATARCSWAATPSRCRPSPTASPIWRTATGRC